MAQSGVVFFHETNHPVVAKADLLELVLGEVIGVVAVLGVLVEAVEARLCELFALLPRAFLHSPPELRVALDSAGRRPSGLLLLAPAGQAADEGGVSGGIDTKRVCKGGSERWAS